MPARPPKCVRCGHPAGKHARGARGGCTLKVPRASGRGRTQFIECPCLTYSDVPDVSRETSPADAAELIAADRARLAETWSQAAPLLAIWPAIWMAITLIFVWPWMHPAMGG